MTNSGIDIEQISKIPIEMDKEWNIFARNIERLMAEQGVSQVWLSRATDHYVSQSALSRIIAGRPTNTDVANAIAKALRVPLWRLFVEPDSIAVQLFDAYMSADPSGRDLIKQLLERERTLADKGK